MTDFLQYLSIKTGMFKPIVPIIEEIMVESKTERIIDLGSGSGGALIGLSPHLREKVPYLKIILTDYYPNVKALEQVKKESDHITYENRSIDARNVPSELTGLRTLFLTFHHFKPADAKSILQNAVDTKNPIAIFEGQERSLPSILAMIFSPITVLLTTPFIRPFSFGRLLFTYLVPIVPILVLWDGVVSSLRTYSIKEMNALIAGVKDNHLFEWKTGKLPSGPSKILYLTGTVK